MNKKSEINHARRNALQIAAVASLIIGSNSNAANAPLTSSSTVNETDNLRITDLVARINWALDNSDFISASSYFAVAGIYQHGTRVVQGQGAINSFFEAHAAQFSHCASVSQNTFIERVDVEQWNSKGYRSVYRKNFVDSEMEPPLLVGLYQIEDMYKYENGSLKILRRQVDTISQKSLPW